MTISYVNKEEFLIYLKKTPSNSLEFIVFVSAVFEQTDERLLEEILYQSSRVLNKGGLLFVQGLPNMLPKLGVFLENHLTFKYWFAVESLPKYEGKLPTVHAGVLLFAKGKSKFNLKKTRLPHLCCKACQKTLKDWGGKAHLMHPDGYVISDVIKDLPIAENYTQLSKELYDLLITLIKIPDKQDQHLFDTKEPRIDGLAGPKEGLAWFNQSKTPKKSNLATKNGIPFFGNSRPNSEISKHSRNDLYNVVHEGDCIEILRQYPNESIDLVFADPPYNLDKNYTEYDDGQTDQQYIEWCNVWLKEYARVLKPTGSLFVLNLPRWGLYHADFLNQHLYFQNWIVWDALSEPRGKIMPAHYALLFYTKSKSDFTFNYQSHSPIDSREYCLRSSCISKRKQNGIDKKTILTDIWWDIHRIKHRRDRDYHPCQLPESLMKRIIELSTNPDDVVLDAFGGTGTTPLTALKLGRRYVAIDMDANYVHLMKQKISELETSGEIQRQPVKQTSHSITKKALQLELRKLTMDLGRLPTPEDVKEKSRYSLDLYLSTFPSWGKALKAAKLEL